MLIWFRWFRFFSVLAAPRYRTPSPTPQLATKASKPAFFVPSDNRLHHKHRSASFSVATRSLHTPSASESFRSPTVRRSSAVPISPTSQPSPRAWNQPGQASLNRSPSLYGSHAPALSTLAEGLLANPFPPHSPQSPSTPSWHVRHTRATSLPQDPPPQQHPRSPQQGAAPSRSQRPVSGFFDKFHKR